MSIVKTLLSFSFVTFFFMGQTLFAQEDSTKTMLETPFKNTIRVNVTSPLIFGNEYMVLGYERVLKRNHTFSVNIGRFSIPKFISFSTPQINLSEEYKDRGFNMSVDYRFYLAKENKYTAPRGIYIGPYYSYNYFKRENYWNINTEALDLDVTTDLIMNIHTVGFELGYQFIFWKRFSLDLILFGPGVGFYKFDKKIEAQLTADEESLVIERLGALIEDHFPGYNLVFSDTNLQDKGTFNLNTVGFRYMIHLGFRF